MCRGEIMGTKGEGRGSEGESRTQERYGAEEKGSLSSGDGVHGKFTSVKRKWVQELPRRIGPGDLALPSYAKQG